MNILTVDDFFSGVISHGFFGRQGGVSSGLYQSLNCSPQSKDDPQNIAENRARVLKALGGDGLSTLKQIHSPICLPVENTCMYGVEEGDALVTKTAGQVIGCLTADCAPVLFAGTDRDGSPVIGAAHAGWGGALKGVLESTIAAMVNLGADLSTIKAAIGPCIGRMSYEVGADFMTPFVEEDKNTNQFFSSLHGDKYLFDLSSYIHFRLNRAGIGHILSVNKDTYALENEYFSFRRATHRGETDYGRQISAISIRCT
jgi:YfiH family protein